MFRRAIVMAAPLVQRQSTRGLTTQEIFGKLKTMRPNMSLGQILGELGPPTPAELPQAIRDGVRLFTKRNWKNVTVREAWLNALVTTEVICWFFVGECLGKGSLIGYQV